MTTATARRVEFQPLPKTDTERTVVPVSEQRARRRFFAATTPERANQVLAGLYQTYFSRVRASLITWGVQSRDADDVCQEVFLVAYRKLSTYEGTASISTWLVGIARKVASDYRRSARSRTEVLVDRAPAGVVERTQDTQLEQRQREAAIRTAVAQLKPSVRAVITGYSLEELPMEEVARAEHVPAQTAYARLYAGRSSLKTALAALANEH